MEFSCDLKGRVMGTRNKRSDADPFVGGKMDFEWLVPFKGREPSGAYSLNFLWSSGNIYLMDNHRAALWCWFRHLRKSFKVNVFHLDRHTDTLYSRIEEWRRHLPDLWTVGLEEYLTKQYTSECQTYPLMRWDNYLSLFLECYPDSVDTCLFATHTWRDEPRFQRLERLYITELPDNLEYWLTSSQNKWICNIDLDYFFYEVDESYRQLVHDSYIDKMFEVLSRQVQNNTILVLTVALSPELCGGWENSEIICERICRIMGIDFRLG